MAEQTITGLKLSELLARKLDTINQSDLVFVTNQLGYGRAEYFSTLIGLLQSGSATIKNYTNISAMLANTDIQTNSFALVQDASGANGLTGGFALYIFQGGLRTSIGNYFLVIAEEWFESKNISFDNTGTGLTAEQAQAAITELKALIDSAATGIKWKENAATHATGNITLSGEQTINGVLTSQSRVMLPAQTDPIENGIWVSDASAWIRATDADGLNEVDSAVITIDPTTSHPDGSTFRQISLNVTPGTDPQTWIDISSATLPDATETVKGKVALASQTDAETIDQVTKEHTKPLTTRALNWALDKLGFFLFKIEMEDHLLDTNNPHEVDKTDVGLGNVDNTSDANKPVSTAQATAIGEKMPKADPAKVGEILQVDGDGSALPSGKKWATLAQAIAGTSDVAVASVLNMWNAFENWITNKTWSGLSTTAKDLIGAINEASQTGGGGGDSHFRGLFISETALGEAVFDPALIAGDYAHVDEGEDFDVIKYIWDASDEKWVQGGAVISVDSVISASSTNPLENRIIKAENDKKLNKWILRDWSEELVFDNDWIIREATLDDDYQYSLVENGNIPHSLIEDYINGNGHTLSFDPNWYPDNGGEFNPNKMNVIYLYRDKDGRIGYTILNRELTTGLSALDTPVNVQAVSGGDTSINITWETSPNSTSYNVYWSATGMSDWNLLTNTTNLGIYDTGLISGTTRYYRIIAIGDGISYSNSPPSDAVSATTGSGSTLSTPTLTLSNIDSIANKAEWTDISGEIAYELERSLNGVTGWTLIYTAEANEIMYIDNNCIPEVQYFYRVRAKGNGTTIMDSAWSTSKNIITNSLIAPTLNLFGGDAKITATPGNYDENATATEMQIATQSNYSDAISVSEHTSLSTTPVVILSLTNNIPYYVRIRTIITINGTTKNSAWVSSSAIPYHYQIVNPSSPNTTVSVSHDDYVQILTTTTGASLNALANRYETNIYNPSSLTCEFRMIQNTASGVDTVRAGIMFDIDNYIVFDNIAGGVARARIFIAGAEVYAFSTSFNVGDLNEYKIELIAGTVKFFIKSSGSWVQQGTTKTEINIGSPVKFAFGKGRTSLNYAWLYKDYTIS